MLKDCSAQAIFITALLAIMRKTGGNLEDAFPINKRFLDIR
jgi:hypothetical protein